MIHKKLNFYSSRSDDRPGGGRGGGRGGGQVRPCDFKFLTADYPPNKTPIATKLWENAFQTIPIISFFDPKNDKTICFCKILNGRLPPKDGSVRPQTLGKRVSDDPRHFIFRRRGKKIDKIFDKNFRLKNSPKNCFRKLPVLEERRYFGPHQQIRLEKWPPILSFSDLCDFWQKGNKAYFDFFPDFWRNMTSSPGGGVIQGVTMVWWYDDMICWHDDIMIRDPRSPGLTWPPPGGGGGGKAELSGPSLWTIKNGHVYFVSLQPAGHRRHDMDVSKLLHIDEEHKVFTVWRTQSLFCLTNTKSLLFEEDKVSSVWRTQNLFFWKNTKSLLVEEQKVFTVWRTQRLCRFKATNKF